MKKKCFIFFIAMILVINTTISIKALEISAKDDTKIEVNLKSTDILKLRIVAEPAGDETIKADRNLPKGFCIPKGLKAYKISAEDSSGNLIEKDKIKGAFTLGLGYPKQINPGLERHLRLFVLYKDKWIPLKSKLDLSKGMIKTESAKQFGIYRLLAPASDINPLKDIFVYPNPVQFGGLEVLNFRNVPGGSVVEIYAVSGEQIRKIDVPLNPNEVIWDGKKENGEFVTSGLYLYRVNMTREEAFGKIVVKR